MYLLTSCRCMTFDPKKIDFTTLVQKWCNLFLFQWYLFCFCTKVTIYGITEKTNCVFKHNVTWFLSFLTINVWHSYLKCSNVKCTYVFVFVCTCVCVCVCMYVCVYVCMYMCVYMYIYVYMCIYTYNF